MNVVRTFPTRAAFTCGAVWVLLALPMAIQGQESPKDDQTGERMQEVVITGSRIARPDLDRLQPTTVVGSQTFDERGYTDVGQALQELPAFGIQPSSAANQQGAFGIAQSFVDLYSLGSQRTLTLVNGRRFVSSNTASLNGPTNPGQQVDLNVIPTKLIDRVETVSVGGAPIYGSDAIAGTVNIILKKDFQGFDGDVQAGVSDDKDAWNYRARALAGTNFADDRGNVTVVGEFNKSDGLVGTSRKSYASDLGFLAPATPGTFNTVLTPNQTVNGLSTSGVPYVDDFFYSPGLPPSAVGITNAAGQPLAFAPGSSALKPYSLGQVTGNPVFSEGGDGIRLSQFSNLLSPTERINFDTLGNFKVTDHINAFAEGWFSETHATNLITQPAYSSALFGAAGMLNGAFKINVNNPFLSAADRQTIQNALNAYQAAGFPLSAMVGGPAGQPIDPAWNADTFYLDRANTDLQSGRATASQVLGRGVVGAGGDFSLGERNYTWEVAMNYGYSRNSSAEPAAVFQNVQNALNATTNSQGNIVCAGNPVAAPISTASSTCAPLNVFGYGSPSAAARAYITHDALASSIDTQRDATLNFSGDIIKLPSGEWKFAAGYENRRESAKFSPDDFYTGGYGTITTSAVEGSYRTNEVYAETLIPVFEPVMDIPALHQVELEGAVRRVDNSIAGDSTTWTAGLRWSPVEDVQFRGNRTTSIRAPAVTELFLPSSTSFEFANDPCDKNFVNQGTSPAIRARNCAAAGINTTTFVSNVVNATAQGMTSGNTGLSSETAISKTYGVVLRPHWVPRLDVSVDYIDIKMANAIEQLNLQALMDACYDSPSYPNNPSCSQFTRNAQHQVTGYHDGFVNAGLLHFQGITVGAGWIADLPANIGRLETRLNYLDTRELVLQVGSEAPVNQAGELGTSTVGNNVAAPKSKGTISFTYLKGPFSWYWQGQYISSMKFNNADTATTKDILGVSPWWLINSTLGYEITKHFTAHLIVNNVFDKQPPFPALAGTGGNFTSATTLYFPGIIGRTYLLNVEARF
jgi:iron complex outermembrane recepter protein